MTLYKGNTKIRDTNSYGVYKGSTPIGAIYKGSQKVYIFNKSTTYQAGTTLQAYQVSPYCTKIRVDCVASRGGAGKNEGGYGGRVTCNLSVTAGQVLYITVGTIPTNYNNRIYNASDIRIGGTEYANRVVVAGGGGSSGASDDQGWNIRGGNGGGLTGADGNNSRGAYGGKGGTQSAGGAGGGYADFGQNGHAGELALGGTSNSTSGCGGAGYYGGGSGGIYTFYSSNGGGGGGGSSYTNPNLCTNVAHTQGYMNGAGYITITEIG